MHELILQQTRASGPLAPSRFSQALALLAKLGSEPRATMHGQELRFAMTMSLEDDACAGMLLDFVAQGARARGTARGPSAALLIWAFHALAASLRCTLTDAVEGRDVEPAPAAHRASAIAYLVGYEADVRAYRMRRDGDDGAAFLAWLAREELVVLDVEPISIGRELPMDDAPAFYEWLLDSDAVEDVFVSERELGWLLARFRARAGSGDRADRGL